MRKLSKKTLQLAPATIRVLACDTLPAVAGGGTSGGNSRDPGGCGHCPIEAFVAAKRVM
jgi:hypothetical protein